MIDTPSSHGLAPGDKLDLYFSAPLSRPPAWAIWRWPSYLRELRFRRRMSGTFYVVGTVSSDVVNQS